MTIPNTPNGPSNPQEEPEFWTSQQSRPPQSVPPIPYVAAPRGANRARGRGLSIAAFCLSLGTILLLFPFTSLSAVPSLVGVPLAAVGLKRAGRRDGLAITALVVSVITLVLGIVMTVLFIQAVSRV